MNQVGNTLPRAAPIEAEAIPKEIDRILEKNGMLDGTYNVRLTLDWNPHDFLKWSGRKAEYGAISRTFTVTGDVAGGVAARGLEFLVQHFDWYAAIWTLDLLDKLAVEYPTAWMAQERDGKAVFARIRGGQTVIFLSTHKKQFVAQVGAILAWVGAALHGTTVPPLAYCTPSMRDEGCDRNWSQLHISYELERVPPLKEHGWYDLFSTTVIARGHEHLVPRRPGLAMTEAVLASLLGPAHVMVSEDGRALLRSKFALLIPTRFSASRREMTWWLLRKEGNDAWFTKSTLDQHDEEFVMRLWKDGMPRIGPRELDHATCHVVGGARFDPTMLD